MPDIKLVRGSASDLRRIYPEFENEFRGEELKDCCHLERLIQDVAARYVLYLARHQDLGDVGYAFVFSVDSRTLWLDYMAVDAKFRNAGFGSQLFNLVKAMLPPDGAGVFAEMEIPDESDPAYEYQRRRLKFYERLGAERLSVDYAFPTKDGASPMYLYFAPGAGQQVLSGQEIERCIASAFDYIHNDVPHAQQILAQLRESIRDHRFGNQIVRQ